MGIETVTAFSAEKTLELLGDTIVGFTIDDDDHLIATKRNGASVDCGLLPAGPEGPSGGISETELNDAITASELARGLGIIKHDTVGTMEAFGFSADTWLDIAGLSITFTPVANRYYEFDATALFSAIADDNVSINLRIVEGASDLVAWGDAFAVSNGRSYAARASKKLKYTGSGSKTYKVQARFSVATEVRCVSDVLPATLSITDLGTML
jgi:hypothetical protein